MLQKDLLLKPEGRRKAVKAFTCKWAVELGVSVCIKRSKKHNVFMKDSPW